MPSFPRLCYNDFVHAVSCFRRIKLALIIRSLSRLKPTKHEVILERNGLF